MYSMAGIIKRKNKWVAICRTLDGKEIRRTTGIDVVPKALMPGANKRAAMAQHEARARLLAEEMEKDIRFGVFDVEKVKAIAGESAAALKARRGGISVNKYLTSWLDARKNKRGALERDGVAVRRFLDFLGDGRDMILSAVSKGMAMDFVQREMERVSPGTVIRYVATLSGAFNAALDRELIPRNPFRGVKPTKTEHESEKQERAAFTMDEVKTILNRFPGEWPDMVHVCLYTGGQAPGRHSHHEMGTNQHGRRPDLHENGKNQAADEQTAHCPVKKILERRMEGRINEFVFPLAAMKHAQGGGKSGKLSLEFTNLLRQHGIIAPRTEEKTATAGNWRKKLPQSAGNGGHGPTPGRSAGGPLSVHRGP